MVKRLAVAIAAATAVLLAALPAKTEPVQLTYKDIRLNGELTVPEGGNLGNGIVLVTQWFVGPSQHGNRGGDP